MPIILKAPGVGTIVRYIGAVEGYKTQDLTPGRIYVLAGMDGLDVATCFVYDDVGDKNYAPAENASGIFEVV